jgi:hypothetical protein
VFADDWDTEFTNDQITVDDAERFPATDVTVLETRTNAECLFAFAKPGTAFVGHVPDATLDGSRHTSTTRAPTIGVAPARGWRERIVRHRIAYCSGTSAVDMTEATDRYPPGSWTVGDVRDALTTDAGGADLPTYDDGSRWRTIAADGLTSDYASLIVEAAESKRGEPVSRLPATLFADYQRTGNRDRYQQAYYDRQHRLTLATLATCLERDGRFLDDVLDHAWATCEATTWLLPAHLPDEERAGGLPTISEPADHHVALFSARTAHMLAEIDHLLGDRLNPALRDRIRREVDRRVLTPFERRDNFHWRQPPTGNWSAVCNASVAMAALYLEDDPDRQAEILVKATSGLEHYLESFGADGCTPEGLAYWNFGFSHYAMLAAALDSRTDGRLSLFTPPVLEEIARFPLRIALSPGRHVPFSDSRETDDVDPYLACYVGEELDVPALTATGRRSLAAAERPFFQRRNRAKPLLVPARVDRDASNARAPALLR